MLDHAAARQNGRDCWFLATLALLRNKGLRLDIDVRRLRAKSRDWLLARGEQYRWFGEDYWSFVNDSSRAWATHLAVLAALSVLSEELHINLEMVTLCTTGTDYLEPVRALSQWPETIRLVYGFDPEHHYVALHEQRAARSRVEKVSPMHMRACLPCMSFPCACSVIMCKRWPILLHV